MVLVSATCQHGVPFRGGYAVFYLLERFLGHGFIIKQAYRLSSTTTVYARGHFFHRAIFKLVLCVEIHLGILGELKGESPELALLEAYEYQGEAIAHHVVQVHDIIEALAGRYLLPTPIYPVGNLDDGVLRFIALTFPAFLHQEVDTVVL